LAWVAFYLLIMVATGTIVRDGGPGWVNLFLIVGFWNACRFTFLIPTSAVRLLRVRHQEKALLRDWQRTHAAEPRGRADGRSGTGRSGVISAEDWSPSDLPAVSYIRVAPTTTDDAASQVERQRAQIALAADRLGLRMADEFVDLGYSGMSMERPGLRRCSTM
jgi:Resolvase, N terminal domain